MNRLTRLFVLLSGLAALADPRPFDPVKDVQVTFSRGEVILGVPPGAHLKGRFLAVALASGPGQLRVGPLPKSRERDEAGDPIFHGEVRIPVAGRGFADEAKLEVRYQPCTEGAAGICYLPLVRNLSVPAAEIPPGGGGEPPDPGASGPLPALADLGGNPFTWASFHGHVVLLDFWASWCGPCRKSFPELERMNQRFGPQGLVVVGVSLDEDPAAAVRFLRTVPVTFQTAQDPGGVWARRFAVAVMPTTVLLDREGKEMARFEGGGRVAAKEAAITALLAGEPLSPETGSMASAGLRATGGLKAWNRGRLADPILNLAGDPVARALREHIHASKEGAAGDGGPAGGGCGCN